MAVTPVEVLTTIARSLVHTRQYRDVDEALRGLALGEVSRKIARYRRRTRRFERKYETDFQAFSARLEDGATIAEEDDWMAWRSTLSLLADWDLLPDTFGETRFFTCLNGQFVAFETLCSPFAHIMTSRRN